MAHARLATVYSNLRRGRLGAESAAKAFELRDRVSERERLYISARHYTALGQEDKVTETYELWVRTYPRDYIPRNNLGVGYNTEGQFEKALVQLQEGLKLNPSAGLTRQNLALAYMGLSRFGEAKAVCQGLTSPGRENLCPNTLFHIAFLENDTAAVQRFTDAASTPGQFVILGNAAALRGKRKQARDFFLRAMDTAAGPANGRIAAALMEVGFGNPQEAERLIGNAATDLLSAMILGQAGAVNRAEELVNASPLPNTGARSQAAIVRAVIEMQRNNPAKAIELLQPLTKNEPGLPTLPGIYLRGQAHLQAGSGTAAASEFQRIIDHPGVAPLNIVHPLARLGIARAYALMGDKEKARKAYEDFFTLWKDADPDIPILIRAKEEFVKLQ